MAIERESSYLSIFLRSLRVVDVRRGLNRFHGAVTSYCALPHRRGGRAEFFVVTTPRDLKDVAAKDAHRVLMLNRRILGPVPYRGGDVELQLGLFSIRSSDLAGPYLELLEEMTSAAGVGFVSPALGFTKPLRKGLELLLGADEPAALEVGLSVNLNPPTAGLFALVGAPRSSGDFSNLRVDDGHLLCFSDGRPVTEHPYVIFSIEAHPIRDDWFNVPGLREAYQEVAREAEKGDLPRTEEALAVLRRIAVLSDDLLAGDGVRLSDRVYEEVAMAFPTRATAADERPLRPLVELNIFG